MSAVKISSACPIASGLTLVTYTVPDRRPRSGPHGQPLIGGGAIDFTFVGQALVGPDGAGLVGRQPNTGNSASLQAEIFKAEHERRAAEAGS
jgi:hypothetical protein